MGKRVILTEGQKKEILNYKNTTATLREISKLCGVTTYKVRMTLNPEKYILNLTPQKVQLVSVEDLDFETNGLFDIDKWGKITY